MIDETVLETLATTVADMKGIAVELKPELLATSHAVHAAAELRFEEKQSSQILQDLLGRHGFSVASGVAGMPTAFMAERSFGAGGPTIAIFCEFDALEGIGHGCGHNIIAAAGVGAAVSAARWLTGYEDARGRILVAGSPAEEGGGGKIRMLESGILAGVDAAIMVHPAGFDAVRRINPGRAAFEVRFHGRASHAAAAPEEGRNALDAATLLLVAIGLLRQQIRPDARIHAIVRDGGQAVNVIPEDTLLSVFLRSPNGEYLRKRLLPALRDCADGAALATGTTVVIKESSPAYLPVEANPVLLALAEHAWAVIGRGTAVGGANGGSSGSTDMGNVSQVIPAIHPYVCVQPGSVLHTRDFADRAVSADGDQAVLDGSALLAAIACTLVRTPALLDDVKRSFLSRRHADIS
jgi:amidohydrolase